MKANASSLCPQVIVDKWNLQLTDVTHPEQDVAAMLAGH
jgi:hypothetical protein